jgi:hypothetical protein
MPTELPSSDELVAHRVAGATYEAISLLYDVPPHRVRYYCRKAAETGRVTPEQIGWKKQPRDFIIPAERYDEHWMKRVLARVKQNENGCWIWQGSVTPKGYGGTNYRSKHASVHRKMFEIVHSVKLKTEDFICHNCDTPACCNPTHLFRGDNAINMADKTKKRRHHAFRATECPKGHPYDEKNTYWKPPSKSRPNPARGCKACAVIRSRLNLGWTQEQAETLPTTPKGMRPVNGTRKTT